jgi:MFS family permease
MTARRRLPRNVWVLGFVSLLMDLSSEIYHALLPVFLTVTLGLPAIALGAVDGIAEATASFAKLASGRLSDRFNRRKPLVLLGYGFSAAAKPLFPLATGLLPVLGARFADRVGKGIRGAPRDAMIADEVPPEQRGAAFGLRQSLDTVGAVLAPVAAVGLMLWLASDIRMVFWIAAVPAVLSLLLAWAALREPQRHAAGEGPQPFFAGFRQLDAPTRRLLGVVFLVMLARFSEGFLVLRAVDAGVPLAWAPLALVLFNLGFLATAYPAGALSDRVRPRGLLMAGMAVLVAADILLSREIGLVGLSLGVLLWGAHMGLTQGVLARMVADVAPPRLVATSFGAFHFVSGIGVLLASLAAGWLWDREGASAAFLAGAGAAAVALAMLSLLPEDERRTA